jgi:hypothetical protein
MSRQDAGLGESDKVSWCPFWCLFGVQESGISKERRSADRASASMKTVKMPDFRTLSKHLISVRSEVQLLPGPFRRSLPRDELFARRGALCSPSSAQRASHCVLRLRTSVCIGGEIRSRVTTTLSLSIDQLITARALFTRLEGYQPDRASRPIVPESRSQ